MKKFINSKVFVAVITAIICITGTAYATTKINASSVEYNNTTVDKVLDDLYNKGDIKSYLDNKNSSFGGTGVTYDGFVVGHKYLALYTSNFWSYETSDAGYPGAYITSGASDIHIISKVEADERVNSGGKSYGAIITFIATDNSITLYYNYRPQHYAMKFIDIT